ncbi:unnamed protein product [Trypanosoma congolense IL3000]|uniref:WGS project CAEQ00000000 data, annotated contig 132 n=1 Tax=Trypanosoma congolense (strain IL3000) TaxID=1068625 RepID=F9W5I5_TRYCI|nr:unnamed protein product [Trypanosoma congolense IL3000]
MSRSRLSHYGTGATHSRGTKCWPPTQGTQRCWHNCSIILERGCSHAPTSMERRVSMRAVYWLLECKPTKPQGYPLVRRMLTDNEDNTPRSGTSSDLLSLICRTIRAITEAPRPSRTSIAFPSAHDPQSLFLSCCVVGGVFRWDFYPLCLVLLHTVCSLSFFIIFSFPCLCTYLLFFFLCGVCG